MALMKQLDRDNLELNIRKQRNWIKEHGATLEGYIERYGDPGLAFCYGNGGTAIFEADTNALKDMEDEFTRRFGNNPLPPNEEIRRALANSKIEIRGYLGEHDESGASFAIHTSLHPGETGPSGLIAKFSGPGVGDFKVSPFLSPYHMYTAFNRELMVRWNRGPVSNDLKVWLARYRSGQWSGGLSIVVASSLEEAKETLKNNLGESRFDGWVFDEDPSDEIVPAGQTQVCVVTGDHYSE